MSPDLVRDETVPEIFRRLAQLSQAPAWTPISSPAMVKARFESVWAEYPEPYQAVIAKTRAEKEISLVTDDISIPASVVVAGHLGGFFYFRWKRISQEQLDAMIVHEIAHYYIDARDGNEWTDYQTGPAAESEGGTDRAKKLMRQVEAEAAKIELDVLQKLGWAARTAQKEISTIVDGAARTLLLIMPADGAAQAWYEQVAAAARREVRVRVVLGFAGDAEPSLDPAAQALPENVSVHAWPPPGGQVPRELFFECTARDGERAFVSLRQTPEAAAAARVPAGVVLTKDDAGKLQHHFEELVDQSLRCLRPA